MNAKDLLPPLTVELEEECDPLLETTIEFEESAHFLDLEDFLFHRLRHTERELTVNLPIVRDSGGVNTFTGLRVQHLTDRGPTMGGVCLASDAHISQIRACAINMTWQLALLDLPLGGSAGAIICNAHELSEHELKHLVKEYVHALRGVVGPTTDVLVPDLGCNDQTMAWMLDSHSRQHGQLELGAVTGKPLELWGLPGYSSANARGILVLLDEILGQRKSVIRGQQISIQGFGTTGSSIARTLHDAGAHVVAIADVSGGLFNQNGIDIPALQEYFQQNRVIIGFPDAEPVCNADVLETSCEILILAATEHQITMTNVERVQASVLLEMTNWAITRAAAKILESHRVLVIPSILSNAGSIMASFLEWTQGVRYTSIPPAGIDQAIDHRVRETFQASGAAADKYSTSIRRAAHLLAVERVAAGLRFQ